jgi:8-oxo-dGTP diphosphatase
MEETGLSIKEPRCLAVTNDFMPNEGKHYVTIFMGVDLASNGQTDPVSDEEQEPKVGSLSIACLNDSSNRGKKKK